MFSFYFTSPSRAKRDTRHLTHCQQACCCPTGSCRHRQVSGNRLADSRATNYTVVFRKSNERLNHGRTLEVCNLSVWASCTSGTWRWRCAVSRKVLSGSYFLRELRATVRAILADSFMTSPKWPVISNEPSADFFSSLPANRCLVVVST